MHKSLKALAIILGVVVVLVVALGGIFVHRKLLEREARQKEYDQIANEKAETFRATILPGSDKFSLEQSFSDRFSGEAWRTAMQADYPLDSLFGRPDGQSVEGLIFPETYEFYITATPEDIVRRGMLELEKTFTANQLAAGFEAQGLTVWQGLTLASIVEREVATPEDRAMVAGIFFNRLRNGWMLGADATANYAWMLAGNPRPATVAEVAAAIAIDSPYNTRKVVGLPPGPIANPSQSSLLAVASPTANAYFFFVSGDDGHTHYARTLAEHNQNIALYCRQKCG